MQLISLKLDGYRRFQTQQTLQIDCRVVSLLGPNEVGKTSVLKALQSLNNKNALLTEGPSKDITRDTNPLANHPVVIAKFLIEERDRKPIEKIKEASVVQWMVAKKHVNGVITHELWPEIIRDRKKRNQGVAALVKAAAELKAIPESRQNTTTEKAHALALDTLSKKWDESEETLPSDLIEKLRELSKTLSNVPYAKFPELAQEVLQFVSREDAEHPSIAAAKIISARMPEFVLFTDADRTLSSNYDMNAFFGAKPTNLPPALENLANAAEISLADVYKASQAKDRGKVTTLIDSANNSLREKMEMAWSQSDVFAKIDWDNNQLAILVGDLASGFESLSERSEGLRQFVALLAFLSRRPIKDRDVVLLIDEAETHLHYDAQADLVQMLTKQRLARQVIYTTHSVGCLPEDLALGIRLIEKADGSRSTINNKFWAHGTPGFSPVLVGMGATTMAFLPVRFCVLTEGITDVLLLPTLFRKAINKDMLGYQVAPGLSETSEERISLLNNEGRRVAFLLDGDDGGLDIEKKLKRANISEEKILSLSGHLGKPCVTEDFVSARLYAKSINAEFERWDVKERITEKEIPDTMRPSALKEWCAAKKIRPPEKINLAYQLLDMKEELDFVEPEKTYALEALHAQIKELFLKVSAKK